MTLVSVAVVIAVIAIVVYITISPSFGCRFQLGSDDRHHCRGVMICSLRGLVVGEMVLLLVEPVEEENHKHEYDAKSDGDAEYLGLQDNATKECHASHKNRIHA